MKQNVTADAPESEEQLISRAQTAVSQCNWTVGECAAQWTRRYAKGRTDADFAQMVGLSPDQVFQRRRVWETFGDVAGDYAALKWSHFYIAVNWDDAPEVLQWAQENDATVAEMKAWRRAMHGEDLSEPAFDDFGGDPAIRFVPTEPTPVRDPAEFAAGERPAAASSREGRGSREGSETVTAVARESEQKNGGAYSPFRQGAGSPAAVSAEDHPGVVIAPPETQPSTVQLVKKMTSTVERLSRLLTPELSDEISGLPVKLRTGLVQAVEELYAKVSTLQE